ncbi:Fe-S oxidoreductase [Methanosarcina barkeri str. Wiesmoor]|uniref:Fe-S oxidoreductase n=2 Tax=Methanosarcina barkeri TaxID=2208 RepID=A0A0E3LKF4_METBA|nr:radical SAM protein [Methanosarcina barkeri]AKB49426.1 Fe-S oxidoreductase [Methanosarcina barkeri str. Wiesmoor]
MRSRIVYGPILSRRLGRSLGIDIIKNTGSKKNCNYDCIYCQLGHVELKIRSPEDVREAVTPEEVSESLQKVISNIEGLDYITFSGTCEPTLNLSLGEMIRNIRKISGVPICVITNSSLLGRGDVQNNLVEADLVVATFVSGNEETWRKIHRPAPGIDLKEIIEGLRKLAKAGTGKRLALEVMLLENEAGEPLNFTDEEIKELVKTIRYICPDEIEILTISRPPSEKWVRPVPEEKLKEIAKRFISEFGDRKVKLVLKEKKKKVKVLRTNVDEEVYALLLRRPCTFEQTCRSLNLDPENLSSVLEKLLGEGKIEIISSEVEKYYRAK